jgi:hypothetical protein
VECHPKEAQWMQLGHLDYLLEMVETFELDKGYEVEWKKHTRNKTCVKVQIQLNVDRDMYINL